MVIDAPRHSIRKAVFPVAAQGTRFMPVTKAMPKALLPIIERPRLTGHAPQTGIRHGVERLVAWFCSAYQSENMNEKSEACG